MGGSGLAARKKEGEVGAVEENFESTLRGEDGGCGGAASEIPAAEAGEVGKGRGGAEFSAGGSRVAHEVEVVAYEPGDAGGEEVVEELGAYFGMSRSVDGFAYVMKEGCCPKSPVVRVASSLVEDLEGMVQGVAFWMKSRILADAVEALKQIE